MPYPKTYAHLKEHVYSYNRLKIKIYETSFGKPPMEINRFHYMKLATENYLVEITKEIQDNADATAKFIPIFRKIVKNSKQILLEYNMLNEFINYNPVYNDYFLDEINFQINKNMIRTFVNDVISCCLSYDSDIKKYNLLRQQHIERQLRAINRI